MPPDRMFFHGLFLNYHFYAPFDMRQGVCYDEYDMMKGYMAHNNPTRGGARATPMKDDHQRKPHATPGETILRVAPSALLVLIGPASAG
jgi:hypothetical protein